MPVHGVFVISVGETFTPSHSFPALHREQVILKQNLILQDEHPSWSVTLKPDDAHHLQHVEGLKYIGGVDLSFIVGNNEDAIATLVILSYPDFKVGYE